MSLNINSDTVMVTDSECESIASKESSEATNFNDLNFLRHQNKRLLEELNIYKQKVKNLEKDNQELRVSKCAMQAKVEVEEEFITNSLFRQIAVLKKNMDNVKSKFEREEECVVSDLTCKLQKLENEKLRLEKLLQDSLHESYDKLNRKIQRLETETKDKQRHLEQLRLDKGDIQNALEQEQESLLNRLWRNISQADTERLLLSEKMDIHSALHKPPKSYAFSKNPNQTKQLFSLKPHDLFNMSMEELKTYVLCLQKELASVQNRTSTLDPEKYQKLLLECNIKDDKHWTRQKISLISDENMRQLSRSRSTSQNKDSSSETFKTPNSKNVSSNSYN